MLTEIIEKAFRSNASDIHITHGTKPIFRINGVLHVQSGSAESTDEPISGYINEIACQDKLKTLSRNKQVDFAVATEWVRCRVNIFMQKGHYDLAIRLIDHRIRSLEELGLKPVLAVSNIFNFELTELIEEKLSKDNLRVNFYVSSEDSIRGYIEKLKAG